MNCTGQLFVLNFKLSFFSLGPKCMPLIHVLRSSVQGQLSISPLSQSTHSSAFLILRKLLISIFTFFFPFLLQFFENNVIKPEKNNISRVYISRDYSFSLCCWCNTTTQFPVPQRRPKATSGFLVGSHSHAGNRSMNEK